MQARIAGKEQVLVPTALLASIVMPAARHAFRVLLARSHQTPGLVLASRVLSERTVALALQAVLPVLLVNIVLAERLRARTAPLVPTLRRRVNQPASFVLRALARPSPQALPLAQAARLVLTVQQEQAHAQTARLDRTVVRMPALVLYVRLDIIALPRLPHVPHALWANIRHKEHLLVPTVPQGRLLVPQEPAPVPSAPLVLQALVEHRAAHSAPQANMLQPGVRLVLHAPTGNIRTAWTPLASHVLLAQLLRHPRPVVLHLQAQRM